jgi:molybdopterin synthase catalytic subunit
MRRHLELTHAPISEVSLLASRRASLTAGGVVTFLGVVRESEAGSAIVALAYEAFVPMAEHQFNRLFDGIERRWPMVESVRLVHRLGQVAAGEASLWVEVAAPHRGESFAACQWLIDEMKRIVPIWKRPVPAGSLA